MPIEYEIDFVSTSSFSRKTWKKKMEFNDERHFENYINKMSKDESKIKIIGFEKIASEEKEFSEADMKEIYNYIFLMFKKKSIDSSLQIESFESILKKIKDKKNGL